MTKSSRISAKELTSLAKKFVKNPTDKRSLQSLSESIKEHLYVGKDHVLILSYENTDEAASNLIIDMIEKVISTRPFKEDSLSHFFVIPIVVMGAYYAPISTKITNLIAKSLVEYDLVDKNTHVSLLNQMVSMEQIVSLSHCQMYDIVDDIFKGLDKGSIKLSFPEQAETDEQINVYFMMGILSGEDNTILQEFFDEAEYPLINETEKWAEDIEYVLEEEIDSECFMMKPSLIYQAIASGIEGVNQILSDSDFAGDTSKDRVLH